MDFFNGLLIALRLGRPMPVFYSILIEKIFHFLVDRWLIVLQDGEGIKGNLFRFFVLLGFFAGFLRLGHSFHHSTNPNQMQPSSRENL